MKKILSVMFVCLLVLSGCTKNIIINEDPYLSDNKGKLPEGRYEINTHPYYGVGLIFDLSDEIEFKDLDVYIVHSEMELALLMAIHIDELAYDFYYVEDRELDYEKIWPYLTALLVNEVEIEDGYVDLPKENPTNTFYSYTFTYNMDKTHKVENAIDEWTYEYKSSYFSDHDKAEYSLMDMLEAVVYDDAALNDEERTDDGYTALGVFQDGQAVCNGYSQAYMGILKDMDIPAILISSDIDDHAWNMIYVDNTWSYVDSTWEDDTYATSDNWYYFLLDQEELEYDHRFDSGNGDTLNAKDYLEFAHYVFPQINDAQ
jgi:hypothetical protein